MGRVLVYLDGAVNLASYAIVAGLAVAVAVAPERRRRAAAAVTLVWLLASVDARFALPVAHGARCELAARVYFGADLIGLFIATVALIIEGRNDIAAKRSPSGASVVALFLVMLDAGILLAPFSPWRNALFAADFKGVQFLITASFAIVTIVQVSLWKYTSRT